MSLAILFPPNAALAIRTPDLVGRDHDPRLRKAARLQPAQNHALPAVRTETGTKADLITPSFGILLGMVDSHLEGVKLWHMLVSRNRNLLGLLRPRLFEAARSNDHTAYGVLAGPFDTSRAAEQNCAILTARGVDCSVTEFRGISPSVRGAAP